MTALPGNGRFRDVSTEIAIGAAPMEESVETSPKAPSIGSSVESRVPPLVRRCYLSRLRLLLYLFSLLRLSLCP